MKKKDFYWSLLSIIMMALLSVGISACGEDEPEPELEISENKLEFDVKSDSKSINILSNVNWTVASNKDWISVSQQSGEQDATIFIEVEENKDFQESRKGHVVITASKGGITRTIEVIQKGIKAQLEVTPTSLAAIKGEGGTVNFNISSNLKWQVNCNQSWLKVDKNEGSGDDFITATVEPNGTSSSRTATLTFKGVEGDVNPVIITLSQEPGGISVSPTSASLLSAKGSTTNLTVSATGAWNLTGCPDWLHASATSGIGNTTITLTALSENWSDEVRSANLTFTANTLTATCNVNQLAGLPSGLRVEMLNMTLMSDGFACDLKFGPEAKGYREAFFTDAVYQTMTDRDIYNELMKQHEYNSVISYAYLPGWVEPGTELIYCVASYGNENNDDGTHKYGPITIKRMKTPQETLESDMHLTYSYNSSTWKVTTSRAGKYGQKCDEYYWLAAEGELAINICEYYSKITNAFLTHFYFKPMIAENSNTNYKYGPQTLSFNRLYDQFFFTAWGINRDTKQFSNELSIPIYLDLSSSSSKEKKRKATSQDDLNKPQHHVTLAEIEKYRKSLKLYKLNK